MNHESHSICALPPLIAPTDIYCMYIPGPAQKGNVLYLAAIIVACLTFAFASYQASAMIRSFPAVPYNCLAS